jgi:hypothetical protein
MRTQILLAFLLCHSLIFSQSLVPNGSFENNCGFNNTCGRFPNGCIPGWIVAHGTPQLVIGAAYDATADIRMWTHNGEGEGIAANLTSNVQKGKEYKLCFAYRTYMEDPSCTTTVYVRLGNGLSYNSGSCAGGAVPPVVPGAQVIFSDQVVGEPANTWSVWHYVSVDFWATDNYSQLLVWPDMQQDCSTSLTTILVDYFSLQEDNISCTDPLIIDMSNYPVPSGTFEDYYYIRAGSHTNGSSTTAVVTIDPNVNTVFRASDYISLEDNFLSAPIRDVAFVAEIKRCNPDCPAGQKLTAPNENKESESISNNSFNIFPNPTSGSFTLQRSDNDIADVKILDLTGRIIIDRKNITETNIILDISDQTAGIYLVRITSGTEVKTLRLIKE